jgi:hypothetical protein
LCGALEGLARFTTNPAGSAIVNTVGPIRQLAGDELAGPRRYPVIATVSGTEAGTPVQIQIP